jgi:hypothetical protein
MAAMACQKKKKRIFLTDFCCKESGEKHKKKGKRERKEGRRKEKGRKKTKKGKGTEGHTAVKNFSYQTSPHGGGLSSVHACGRKGTINTTLGH